MRYIVIGWISQSCLSVVLHFTVHLQYRAELAECDATDIIADWSPNTIHDSDFSTHRNNKEPITAARSQGTFTHFWGQCAQEARETAVGVNTATAVLKAATYARRPFPLIQRVESSHSPSSTWLHDDHGLLLLLTPTVTLLWLLSVIHSVDDV